MENVKKLIESDLSIEDIRGQILSENRTLNENTGQALKELSDLAVLLKDNYQDNFKDIRAALEDMSGNQVNTLAKQVLSLQKKLTDLSNKGFDINKKK